MLAEEYAYINAFALSFGMQLNLETNENQGKIDLM